MKDMYDGISYVLVREDERGAHIVVYDDNDQPVAAFPNCQEWGHERFMQEIGDLRTDPTFWQEWVLDEMETDTPADFSRGNIIGNVGELGLYVYPGAMGMAGRRIFNISESTAKLWEGRPNAATEWWITQ